MATVAFRRSVKFPSGGQAVRLEKAERVNLDPSASYELLSQEVGRNNTVICIMKDPQVTHPGGDDGKTDCPCTLKTQMAADLVSIK